MPYFLATWAVESWLPPTSEVISTSGTRLSASRCFCPNAPCPATQIFIFALSNLSCLSHAPQRRHCERSEAIQCGAAELDCFVASLLAMTISCERDRLSHAPRRASSCRRAFWTFPRVFSRRGDAAPE